MTAEDRELIAHAIWTTGRTRAVDRYPLADALMPVVDVIARRRVAAYLRDHADELTDYEEMPLACWEKQLVTEPFEQFTCALPTGHDGPCVR